MLYLREPYTLHMDSKEIKRILREVILEDQALIEECATHILANGGTVKDLEEVLHGASIEFCATFTNSLSEEETKEAFYKCYESLWNSKDPTEYDLLIECIDFFSKDAEERIYCKRLLGIPPFERKPASELADELEKKTEEIIDEVKKIQENIPKGFTILIYYSFLLSLIKITKNA